MKEEWKVVEGFDNYLVSNLGRVLSIAREKPKYLKFDKTRKYSCVTLCKNAETKRIFVHILVASHFIPNIECKPEVNHLDGDKFNNRVDNLEWCTRSENTLHAFSIGLQGVGERMYGAKRTDEQIRLVCELIQSGLKRKQILDQCPYLSKAVFDHIRSRRRWTFISKDYVW